ncbi:tRNA pseudouridine synthase A [Usitatibacter rugosus]|uniref:tRNA pseudouridine synthase A n=1 Tax=Usitatibacter rugosus TaxID=2732067 RepID=A0A6M4GTR4_9PROT|nr:tRNA pseudouridine(38-40) synthase TruA [Usitatibacter rugosus]QJR10516.1 tRNA pseudouridine synthase A [Usitatibacter rugosus]
MRIALGLEYDGSAFCGWQSQPGGCGVQDHLEKALSTFADRPVSVLAAGRTDTGVHATAQVVHFDTDAQRDDNSWVRGPNSYLDPRVRVLWARPVPDEFHARFSARSRTYYYLLLDDPVAPAALNARMGWFHKPLDVAAMSATMGMFLGEHDFSAFRDAQCQAKSPVKVMHEARIERRGNMIVFTFRASAFLHHMVRNLVGSLVYVGAGRFDAEALAKVFASLDRRNAAPTFAPDGLYLAAIEYDPAFALPAFRPFPLFPS